jgi:hypothetical protein
VTPFIAAGAGFLLAVLWFDLMFDVQVLACAAGELPAPVLASIAGYYRRVTTAARPMNRLVAAAMLGTAGTIVAELVRGDRPGWVGWVSLVLAVGAIGLAAVHTVPSAVSLGSQHGSGAEQSRLARGILRDHLICFGAILALLAIQLSFAS